MRSVRISMVGWLVFLVAAAGLARTVGGIKGRIIDEEGNPVVGASVVLVHVKFQTSHEFTTREDGTFVQMGMKPGDYDVSIEAEGFVPQRGTMHISLAARTPFEATLVKEEPAGPQFVNKVGDEEVSQEVGDAMIAAQQAWEADRRQEAVDQLEALRLQQPDITGILFMLADWYQIQGQNDRALELLSDALEKRPDKARGHLAKGELLEEMGQSDQALACYRTAVEENPKLARAQKKLGMALLAKSDFAGAADALERYVELAPAGSDTTQEKIMASEARKLASK